MESRELQLLSMLLGKKRTFFELLELSDSFTLSLAEALQSLKKKKLIEYKNFLFSLTKKAKVFAEKNNLTPFNSIFIKKGFRKGIDFSSYKDLIKKFKKFHLKKPESDSSFLQGAMRAEDVIARIALANEYFDLKNKSILVIGDDDLLSIALALTKLPKKIIVLEIDERIVDFLNNEAVKQGFPIKAEKFNVEFPLPEKYLNNFDCFFSDPVESLEGITLFLSRGASALKKNSSMYFGLTRMDASLKKWFEIQKRLLKMNFVLTDIFPGFSFYPEENNKLTAKEMNKYLRNFFKVSQPNVDYYKSVFIRAQAVSLPKPLIKGKKFLKEKFYFDKETVFV
ncbi:MAG TPA: bis-aminopropyl spermidine synthase family protein [archaeon]|nr:bis-aminopropyl spermidine synthase family protein [archaeon]